MAATGIVDLRSDTVTRPSAGMRRAMAEAEVGDDPTVNRLQERAAALFGFEQSLYFPTGTQSNLAALMSHCQRGDEALVGQEAHTYRYEAGGGAVLGSIQPQAIANRPDGTLDLAEVEAQIKPDDPHFARTRLLALENTITGISLHDCGWPIHDERPTLNPDRIPLDVFESPPKPVFTDPGSTYATRMPS